MAVLGPAFVLGRATQQGAAADGRPATRLVCGSAWSLCATKAERPVMSKVVMPLLLALLFLPTGPGLANGTDSRIVHVVLIWLKEPENADHRAQIIEATRGFSTIPGIDEIRVGEHVPSQRSTVDDSFDIGLYMIFSSKRALETYLAHPEHKAAQRSILRPLVRKAVIYDFWDDGT